MFGAGHVHETSGGHFDFELKFPITGISAKDFGKSVDGVLRMFGFVE